MAKLIKILVASVGGGLVLGAGIRLGEAIATQLPVSSGGEASNRLAERLGDLENRLVSLEAESPATIATRLEQQAADVSAVRTQLDSDDRQIEVLSETSVRLRGDLRDWIEESVTARIAEVESRLRAESDRGQKQLLDAFAESIQTRVIQRISRLEEEVAGQSASMSELRECSLRTEQSMQKLLGGLDRLIVKNAPVVEEVKQPAADIAPVPPPVDEPRPKSSRWKIFG